MLMLSTAGQTLDRLIASIFPPIARMNPVSPFRVTPLETRVPAADGLGVLVGGLTAGTLLYDSPVTAETAVSAPEVFTPTVSATLFEPIDLTFSAPPESPPLAGGTSFQGVTISEPTQVPVGLFAMPSSFDELPASGGTVSGGQMPAGENPAGDSGSAAPASGTQSSDNSQSISQPASPDTTTGPNTFAPESESDTSGETTLTPSQTSSSSTPATVSGLYNTGVDDNNHVLSSGRIDTHYELVSDPDPAISGSVTRVVDPSGFPLINGPWAQNNSTSSWLSPLSDGNTSVAAGDYVYQTTFTLTGDVSTFELTGQWATDNDGVDIMLNGVQIAGSTPHEDFAFHQLSATTGFVSGLNTLEFRVHNDPLPGDPATGNPTGLRVEFDQTTVTPTPPITNVSTLFSTGLDASGQLASGGSDDAHWTLAQSPDSSQVGQAAKVLPSAWPIAPQGPWVANDSTAQWITAGANGASNAMPGDYVYETSFDWTGQNLAALTVAGRWASDNNGVDIRINGQSTGYTTPFEEFQFHDFSISSSFVSGINTLQFVVHNGGNSPNPTGLRVEFLTPLPEVYFIPTDEAVLHEGATGNVTLHRDGDISQGLTVRINTQAGTVSQAGFGTDYLLSQAASGWDQSGGWVTFLAGQNEAQIGIAAIEDNVIESEEGFAFVIAENSPDYAAGRNAGLNKAIDIYVIDALAEVSISPSVQTIAEGNEGTLTISRSGNLATSLQVGYVISEEDPNQPRAMLGIDYTLALADGVGGETAISSSRGLIDLTPNTTSVTLVVRAISDNLTEALEGFRFTMLDDQRPFERYEIVGGSYGDIIITDTTPSQNSVIPTVNVGVYPETSGQQFDPMNPLTPIVIDVTDRVSVDSEMSTSVLYGFLTVSVSLPSQQALSVTVTFDHGQVLEMSVDADDEQGWQSTIVLTGQATELTDRLSRLVYKPQDGYRGTSSVSIFADVWQSQQNTFVSLGQQQTTVKWSQIPSTQIFPQSPEFVQLNTRRWESNRDTFDKTTGYVTRNVNGKDLTVYKDKYSQILVNVALRYHQLSNQDQARFNGPSWMNHYFIENDVPLMRVAKPAAGANYHLFAFTGTGEDPAWLASSAKIITHMRDDLFANDTRNAGAFLANTPVFTSLSAPGDSDVEAAVGYALTHYTAGDNIVVIGWSRGAVLAVELARQLAYKGVRIQFAGLLDPVATFLRDSPQYLPYNIDYGVVSYKKDRSERLIFNTWTFVNNQKNVLEAEFDFKHRQAWAGTGYDQAIQEIITRALAVKVTFSKGGADYY